MMHETEHGSATALASIDQVPIVVWEVDVATFRFTYVSGHAERLLGFPLERWLLEPDFFWNQIHPADREPTRARCVAATERGEDHLLEYRMIAADGRVLDIRDHAHVTRAPDGRPLRLIGTITDVTEERRARLERDAIGRVSRRLVEAETLDEVLRDLPGLVVPDFGYSLSALLLGRAGDREVWCVGTSADAPCGSNEPVTQHEPVSFAVEASVAGEVIRRGRPVVVRDLRSDRPDLDPRLIANGLVAVLSVPLIGEHGVCGALSLFAREPRVASPSTVRTLQIIGRLVGLEIDRRETLAAVRVREQALEAVEQAVLITDRRRPGAPLVFVSPAFERLVGRPPQASFFAEGWLSDDSDPAAVAALRTAVADERPHVAELGLRRGDGSSLRAAVSFAPIRDAAGHVTHHVVLLADVSRQRQMENELARAQKLEALGRLAGAIAHDFNNLLTVVVGYGETVKAALGAGHPASGDVDEICKAGARGARLTAQMLSFCRRRGAEPRVLDMNEVLRDVEPMLERLLHEEVRFVVALAEAPLRVCIDRSQLEQIVMNLVLNARDAMPKGGTLSIATAAVATGEADAPRRVSLVVSDTGHGMDAATRQRMFEPFFTTKAKGTGLGLATVYGAVKSAGGTIEVRSAPGVGTVIHVRLPEAAAPGDSEDAVAARANDAEERPVLRGHGESILLVEDDALVRRMSRDILLRAGFRVRETANGHEALAALVGEHGFRLVVSDISMPGMNGVDLARRIARKHPGLPCLLVSGYADGAPDGGKPWGGPMLHKPFSADEFIARVRATIDGALPARDGPAASELDGTA